MFKRLKVTNNTIKVNIRDTSFRKVLDMLNQTDTFTVNPPIVQGRNELLWSVRSQQNKSIIYNILISPRLLMTHNNTRDSFKNFRFDCSCEDFKEIVSLFVSPKYGYCKKLDLRELKNIY